MKIMLLMKILSVTNAEKFLQVVGLLEAMLLGYTQVRAMLTKRRYRGEMKESLNEDYSHSPKIDTDRSMGQG